MAKKLIDESINVDSVQVYKNIPIITNKHPILERETVILHVMNHVPWVEGYFIHRFEKDCLGAIKTIYKRGKLPIVVGGTHFYL